MEEFEAAKPSMDTPFVVFEKGTDGTYKLVYSNLVEISEDELDTTEYIDLGLPSGLKWASCNIGATKPCESGLLFQFGRVDGYAYGDTNHQFSSDSIPTTTSGFPYGAGTVLGTYDDAAYHATNGKAHMPTAADIKELLAGTTNEWCQCSMLDDTHNGHTVLGRLFTSTTNGKKIFIPAAGYFKSSFMFAGSKCNLWSSSVYSEYARSAYVLYFDSSNCFRSTFDRYHGFPVRGVMSASANLPEISEDELDTAEYVDLGLPSGLKWASCNIGASKPCEPGLLFQFGRVDGYAYGDTSHQFSTDSIPTTTSGKTYGVDDILDPEDDAAYHATNGKAHMPTKADIDELLAGTTNEWRQCTILDDTHNGHTVYGRLFTSIINGNKIFIPAAGYFNGGDGSFYNAGSYGSVWSSSVYSDSDGKAANLYFYSGACDRYGNGRRSGYSVRGVMGGRKI